MSFWKNLFGGGNSAESAPAGDKSLGEESYKGFTIKAIEMRAGSEFQLAGVIEKDFAGELKTDRMSSKDDLVVLALSKGRQIIDEQGDGIYR
jgi:hypothetical protein